MSLHRALAHAHSALLPAVPPFSLAASLAAMSGFRPSAGDQLIMSDRLRKGLAHPDEPGEAVVIEVAPRPDAAPGVRLEVFTASPLSAAGAAAVERWVRAWLSLDDDMRPVLELASDDPPVAALLPLVHGLHQVRFGRADAGKQFRVADCATRREVSFFVGLSPLTREILVPGLAGRSDKIPHRGTLVSGLEMGGGREVIRQGIVG